MVQKDKGTAADTNIADLNSQDETRTLATGVQSQEYESTWNMRGDSSDHSEVPGRKYNSVRVANSTAMQKNRASMCQPESADATNEVFNGRGKKRPIVVRTTILKDC
jgi:cyclin-dependent kinase 12/13